MTGISTPTTIPDFVARWYGGLTPRSLAAEIVDPVTAAVISTDMIVGFCRSGALASERVDALTGPVVELFQAAYAHGVRRFALLQDTHDPRAVEFETWPVHCVRGTAEAETLPELRALPFFSEIAVIEKNTLHPALGTDFDRWLDEQPGLRTAIVAGDCTDLCVYQLAMHLRLRANMRGIAGFRVIVPANAVDTYDFAGDAAHATAHPGEFFHQVFLYHLALNGIEVVRSLSA